MTSPNFTSVPVLDYSLLSDPQTRAHFIEQLRHALINVGFLYLSNHPVPTADLVSYIPKLFELPQQAKDDIKMSNSPHFLGYSKLGAEFTRGQVDHREFPDSTVGHRLELTGLVSTGEQIDFATVHTCRWKEGDPDYYRLWGPSQWPDERLIPGFEQVTTQYLEGVQALSYQLASLIGEALGLGPDGLSRFYDSEELMQHRAKIVKYPSSETYNQGVGPHYDAGFLTFVSLHWTGRRGSTSYAPLQLLQASPHTGLQVQNLTGDWIDVPPILDTFVVNIGKGTVPKVPSFFEYH